MPLPVTTPRERAPRERDEAHLEQNRNNVKEKMHSKTVGLMDVRMGLR
jgi:hypothetical protein